MQQQKQDRINNLQRLKELGFDPFGGRFSTTGLIKQVVEGYSDLPASRGQAGERAKVRLAGRILSIRPHGKAAFLDIKDWTGKIQVYIKKDKVPEKVYQLYEALDIGDIIGASGSLFKTRTGEITILTEELTILSKSLLPMPEKWHGLRDVEIRYRQRYLDLISNPEVMEKFLARVEIIKSIRNFFDQKGFVEVETPMMQPLPGGATARPFITHHNTLDMDLYLRIAPELYLKRLLVGGMERVYEINRNFRNEGISTQHNPEFTMVELYQAYGNYQDMMDLTEGLITELVRKVTPSLKLTYNESELDFSPPWKRASYSELFQKYLGFSWQDKKQVKEKCRQLQVAAGWRASPEGREAKGKSDEALAHDLFEKSVEPNLAGPVFVVDYPTAVCPLTKAKPDTPEICERFELFIAQMEIANAFTELNDPVEQRQRFEDQVAERAEGAVKIDEDFINALEYGMPPAGGLGIGIDRLVMILTNLPSIRDVILFPTLREK